MPPQVCVTPSPRTKASSLYLTCPPAPAPSQARPEQLPATNPPFRAESALHNLPFRASPSLIKIFHVKYFSDSIPYAMILRREEGRVDAVWYLINPRTGTVRTGNTKTELSIWWYDCHRAYKVGGKWAYIVRQSGGHTSYLYHDRQQAFDDGLGFAIQLSETGGERCDADACPYNKFGYCSKNPPVKEDAECHEIPQI